MSICTTDRRPLYAVDIAGLYANNYQMRISPSVEQILDFFDSLAE